MRLRSCSRTSSERRKIIIVWRETVGVMQRRTSFAYHSTIESSEHATSAWIGMRPVRVHA
eukprot:3205394-Prymnesium_polylepis.3